MYVQHQYTEIINYRVLDFLYALRELRYESVRPFVYLCDEILYEFVVFAREIINFLRQKKKNEADPDWKKKENYR